MTNRPATQPTTLTSTGFSAAPTTANRWSAFTGGAPALAQTPASTSYRNDGLDAVRQGRMTLHTGTRGAAVRALQQKLNAAGAHPALGVDGDFGPRTRQAVMTFQQAHGLTPDGVVGPKTMAALDRLPSSAPTNATRPTNTGSATSVLDPVRNGLQVLRRGSHGPAVQQMQTLLNRNGGANLRVDGEYGPATEAAVRQYQFSRGLKVDGQVGAQTLRALESNSPAQAVPTDLPGGVFSQTGYRSGAPFNFQATRVGNHVMSVDTARAFLQMKEAARRDGVNLDVVSAFRTYEQQADLYRRYRNGTGNLAARPGYSNHQSGIALDFETNGGTNAAYRWLQNHGNQYGFHRTVSSEPWHWEYRP